ncbi:HD family phosphohydrolase [Actinomycetes bacterium NPDC127524]
MGGFQRFVKRMRVLMDSRSFQLLLFAVLGVFSYLMMYTNVKPEKVHIELFKPAEQTIRATKTVEDPVKTKEQVEDSIKQVSDIYTLKKEYAQNKVDLISSIFDSALEVQKETAPSLSADKANQDGSKTSPVKTVQEKVSLLKSKLTDEVNKDIPDQVFEALANADTTELNIAKDSVITAVNKVMNSRVTAVDVEMARNKAEQELRSSSLHTDMREAATTLARSAIIQNVFYDKDKTEEQRKIAQENVDPVRILQGQIIVEEGQLIDREIYRQLELAGFLSTDKTILPFVGLFLFIFLILSTFYYYVKSSKTEGEHRNNQLLIFSLVYVLALSLMKIISLFTGFRFTDLGYFFPAAMSAMLIKTLLNDRFGVAISIIIGAYGTLIFNGDSPGNMDFAKGMYFLFSGIAAIIILSRKNFKTKILQAGLLLALVNIVLVFSLLFITDGHYTKMEYLFYTIAAIVSGLASSVLTIGLLPFFELGFGFLSSMKLIELSNPNHPLLRKILTEAPGTYHHSVMVANLAEGACEAIGANGLLARVGCYYHDIGKTKRPQFFIENQMNIKNPHDRLPPATSKNIIIAHAVDGAQMLSAHKFPPEIIDIAAQHHGTSLLKFFYYKAMKEDEGTIEAEYRYPGPKAQSKEAAVIGIADSVEAAVRSMNHPTPEKIEELVIHIIDDRIHDHQFDECDITMKELKIVQHSLCETLNGIFHSRIEYPELQNLQRR